MYSCDVKLLIKSCGVNMRPFHLWRQSQVPLEYCSIASFGQHLISIGKGVDKGGAGGLKPPHFSCKN